MARIGVYLRISEDKDGEQTATARQLADCKAFVKRHGWEVAEVYEDVEVSAFKSVKRPRFEDMLADIRNGTVDGVVAWKMDRRARQLRDLVRLEDACSARPPAWFMTDRDGIDSRGPTGELIAHMMTAASDGRRDHRRARTIRVQ